jgi:hypothetical protein
MHLVALGVLRFQTALQQNRRVRLRREQKGFFTFRRRRALVARFRGAQTGTKSRSRIPSGDVAQ